MTDKLKQKIKEELKKMPKEAEEAINNFDWANPSEEIGKKHLLNESETNDLQVKIGLVLIGLIDPRFLSQEIETDVGINTEEAVKVTNEITEKIFAPITEKITEKIKNGLKNNNPSFEKNVTFILSGGDYSAFLLVYNTNNTVPVSEEAPSPANKTSNETLLVNFLKKQ